MTYALSLAAAALHLYENAVLASGFSWGWWLWQMMPYAIVLLLARFSRLGIALVPGAALALAIDLWTHYAVFVAPTSSTAALAVIWMPIWNTVVIVPVATGISWLIAWAWRKNRATAADTADRAR